MRLETTCRSMPNQIEGELDEGRPFYFRARCGGWYLAVGELGDTIDDICLNEDLHGESKWAGWWNQARAEQFCRAAIKRWQAHGALKETK